MGKLRIEKNPRTRLYRIMDGKNEHWLNDIAAEQTSEDGDGIPTLKKAEAALRGLQARDDAEAFITERLQAMLIEARDRYWVKELEWFSTIFGILEEVVTHDLEEWAEKQRRMVA